MEGVTFACYDGYQVLAELGARPERIILAGGGARSELWQQMVADVFGLPVPAVPCRRSVGQGIGAAGRRGDRRLRSGDDRTQMGVLRRPGRAHLQRHARYQEIFPSFQAVYRTQQGSIRIGAS